MRRLGLWRGNSLHSSPSPSTSAARLWGLSSSFLLLNVGRLTSRCCISSLSRPAFSHICLFYASSCLSTAPCLPTICCSSHTLFIALCLHICSTHATGSLLECLFAPCAPQLSSFVYLLHACLSSLLACLFAPCMPRLSPCSPICSVHAAGSLLACLFSPCMPQAFSFAYLLHACYKLHPCLPICPMHATGSPFLTHFLHACHELSVAVLPHACPSVRAARRHRLSSSRPESDRRTTSPRSSLGTLGPSPTTPTNV